MKLTIEQKCGLFNMLLTKKLYEVGLEFGFDKYYKDSKAIKGAVYRVYADIKNNPDKYGIQPDTYEKVIKAMSERSSTNHGQPVTIKVGGTTIVSNSHNTTLREKIDDISIKDIVLSNRDKVAILLSRKLDDIGSSKKKLSAVPLGSLSLAFCQIFDKGQIIQGEATEHIAHLAKIEEGLTAEQLLGAVISQRNSLIAKKNK